MKTLTTEQMRQADHRCIHELGIPGAVLMDHAGLAVFAQVKQGPVGIVCGKGNNGGDGFVTAQYALMAGMDTRVLLLAAPEDMSGDAARFMEVYRRLGGTLHVATEEAAVRSKLALFADCATVIDAMLGTGVKGEISGLPRVAIEAWPEAYTIAIDVPTGLNADAGTAAGAAIRADVTVAIQFAKRGYTEASAAEYLGRLMIADIGIPDACADDAAWAAIAARI